MKKIILGAAVLLCLSACSYRIYPVSILADNYEMSMQTPQEQAAKESVAIYLSENEVPGPYKLLAFAENRPILPVAIADQQLKNFYKQAVLKAYEMGGNAIIVESIRSFKVIQVSGGPTRKAAAQGAAPAPRTKTAPATGITRSAPSRPEPSVRSESAPRRERFVRDTAPKKEPAAAKESAPRRETAVKSEAAPKKEAAPKPRPAVRTEPVQTKAEPVVASLDDDNPIFDESTVQWFTSGYVYRAKEQEQIEIIETMNEEILQNLQVCKTLEEAHCISKKIDLIEKYNQALPVPSGTQTGKIKAYRNSLNKIMTELHGAQTGKTPDTVKAPDAAKTPAVRQNSGQDKKGSGFLDGAVESVKGFFSKLKKK